MAKNYRNIIFGIALMGGTGMLIGLVLHSYLLMGLAGGFGAILGWLVGWLGGWRYLSIICLGVLLGAALGYSTGDRDIIIMSAGSGAAIAGFLGAQLERFLKK
ncbi:MAG: hypothetical protein ACE5G9_09765 [Nitrospinales bacterium]